VRIGGNTPACGKSYVRNGGKKATAELGVPELDGGRRTDQSGGYGKKKKTSTFAPTGTVPEKERFNKGKNSGTEKIPFATLETKRLEPGQQTQKRGCSLKKVLHRERLLDAGNALGELV